MKVANRTTMLELADEASRRRDRDAKHLLILGPRGMNP
jgi:hypothetical protein